MDAFIIALNIVLFIFALLPIVKNDYWVFRVFDYPRIQKLALSAVALVLNLFVLSGSPLVQQLLCITMAVNIIYLCKQVLPFTRFGKKQVLRATNNMPAQSVCVMIANVLQDNKNTAGCLQVIARHNPDVVLLLETDQFWERQTNTLAQTYSYAIKAPLENKYGMLLYSKLPMTGQVKYLVEDDIPSIHALVTLPGGQLIKLFAVHPTPPVPNENPRSTERDKELLLVADLAKACTHPVIVVGDLNDVAWSYTTELFLKMSGLIDPRRGRGFFNSFHAHYPFLRFPLDHAFISTHFKLKNMKRLSNFGSDHFPIYIALQYEQNAENQQQSLAPEQEDVEIAEEKKQAV